MAAGEPGTESGRTKLESSRRVPSPGGFSMTISVRESGMPQTVSKNSPSTNALPSTSRPSATKKAVTTSRSATVMPTWSKRRTCDMDRAPVVVSNMYLPRQTAFTVPRPTEEAGRHHMNVHNSAVERDPRSRRGSAPLGVAEHLGNQAAHVVADPIGVLHRLA